MTGIYPLLITSEFIFCNNDISASLKHRNDVHTFLLTEDVYSVTKFPVDFHFTVASSLYNKNVITMYLYSFST